MNRPKKVLVTGAGGFVGRAVCQELRKKNLAFTGSVRRPDGETVSHIAEISATTNWSGALNGCDTVIHLAARVHVMNENGSSGIGVYRDTNLYATLHLAEEALKHGVARFIFVSTIKVNGESSGAVPFSSEDVPQPHGSYSISKFEAEQALISMCESSSMELIIVRPPLVYGPGVRANFLRLMKLVRLGMPLPFGSVTAKRSMIAVENLANFLVLICSHPKAANRIWLVSDGCDLKIGDLIRLVSSAMGKPALLFPIPVPVLRLFATLVGKGEQLDRFVNPLCVEISDAVNELGWTPVISTGEAINNTVRHFLKMKANGK